MSHTINHNRGTKVLLVSAAASSQGKTTVTAALARKLRQQGRKVRVFKTGPDFLDPKILERANGAPVYNLDLWIVGLEACRQFLTQAAQEADVILIEGVMGLYDGTPSSADLARAFGVPVLAVINVAAMAQTAGAIALGLRDFGPVDLAGVIANHVGSAAHAQMVAASLRDIPLLGNLPRQQQSLPERHLGLVQASEIVELDSLLDKLAEQLTLDENAWDALPNVHFEAAAMQEAMVPLLANRTIAIARDAAFGFHYQANIDCLRALGAKVVYFSPLADEPVPAEANSVYLPGGYPELFAQTLSQATHWKQSIRAAHAAGMPIWAECGGMMAVSETLTDQQGQSWKMAGLLPAAVAMQPRLAGLGSLGLPTPFGELRGHDFHYSRMECKVDPIASTVKHPSGKVGEVVYRHGSLTASYFHPYFSSCPQAAAALFLPDDFLVIPAIST
jgi:cobyrinic acid a,c-diamide synthase